MEDLKKHPNKYDLYVELDTIIDTRLPILHYIDENLVTKIMKEDTYINRIKDSFGVIDTQLFEQIYSKRTKLILEDPIPTKLLKMMYEYTMEAKEASIEIGDTGLVTIHLNIFPYDLNDEEVSLITKGLLAVVPSNVNVSVINKSNYDLHPSWIKENIGMMIKYDALKWIDLHLALGTLISSPIPEVLVIAPALVSRNLILNKKDTSGFFKDIESSMALFVKLQFMASVHFSIDI